MLQVLTEEKHHGLLPTHDFINRCTYKLNRRHLYSVEDQKRLEVAKTIR